MIPFEEFENLAKAYNVIPLVRTMMADMHTPVSTYLTMREGASASFLFESVEPNEKIGRHSFIGINPSMTVKAKGKTVEVREGSVSRSCTGNIFDALGELESRFHQAPTPSAYDLAEGRAAIASMMGFLGGFVGYLGYNNVRHLEKLPLPEPGPYDGDDAAFGMFDSLIRFDHRRQMITIVHNVIVDPHKTIRQQYEEARKIIDTLELRLRKTAVATYTFACDTSRVDDGMDRHLYCKGVLRAKEYIVEGDIFQVVLSRKIRLQYSGDLFPVYRALRIINPSPYLYYVDFGDTKLVGSSPEVLVRVQNGDVEVLPIAGTRQRGGTEEEDRNLEEELLHDEKELAEHIMLVDLGRNDVGRICEFGSVEVPVLKRVEKYSHVMHLVSEVRGKLKAGSTALDALKACFPAGTVSGAPKVRAMEIINELERGARGVYAGAVGYLGFNGTLDTCIAIRTIVAHRDTLYIQAGAGIVADSVPEREFQETVNKAEALLEAVALASRGLDQLYGTSGQRQRQG